MKSLQETYAPGHICFGCGPANEKGLRIRSFPHDDGTVVMTFNPGVEHQAFRDVVCGGILGTLIDCHSGWAAAWHLGDRGKDGFLPCTITAGFSVQLLRPAPLRPLEVVATLKTSLIGRAVVTATVTADGVVCTRGEGTFVVVDGSAHPAFGPWVRQGD